MSVQPKSEVIGREREQADLTALTEHIRGGPVGRDTARRRQHGKVDVLAFAVQSRAQGSG